jgi:hypothetical protein
VAVDVKAGLVVEGDRVRNPKTGGLIEVKRSASMDGGAKVRLLLAGLRPMTWPADFEVECERGETGQAIDLCGLGQEEVLSSGEPG